jgi:multicomponent Na+:H+ antiporter subunit D
LSSTGATPRASHRGPGAQTTVGMPTEVKPARSIPVIMVGATAAMVALSVALTIFAAPLYDLTSRAGDNITGPGYYITTVFTGESK